MTVRDRVAAGAVGKAVVLGPQHRDPGPVGRPGGRARASTSAPTGRWTHQLTALTYQALAVFDPDDEVDDDGQERRWLRRGLRGNCLETGDLDGCLESHRSHRLQPGFEAQALNASHLSHRPAPALLDRLHENGRAFIEQLQATPDRCCWSSTSATTCSRCGAG